MEVSEPSCLSKHDSVARSLEEQPLIDQCSLGIVLGRDLALFVVLLSQIAEDRVRLPKSRRAINNSGDAAVLSYALADAMQSSDGLTGFRDVWSSALC